MSGEMQSNPQHQVLVDLCCLAASRKAWPEDSREPAGGSVCPCTGRGPRGLLASAPHCPPPRRHERSAGGQPRTSQNPGNPVVNHEAAHCLLWALK